MVGDFDAVDVRFEDVGVGAEGGADFGGGDVFGFPAEGVADAVVEEPAALGVPAEDVTGAEVSVPGDEDVVEDFALRGGGVVVVALEFGVGVFGVELEEELAWLAGGDGRAEVVVAGVAEGRVGVWVQCDEGELVFED